MKQLIGIIADDLTGANDSGVQLTEKGINTSVLFDIPSLGTSLDKGIVIDTNSRALTEEEAVSVTKQASLFLKEAGYRHIYKKMDSTLRGHIGAELQAAARIFEPEFVFIAPAFPSMGRTTKDGIHYVHGVKIAETEISKDPKHPVKDSYIPRIIETDTGKPAGLISKEDLESDSVFQEKISEFKSKGIVYVVSDAETQEQLQAAAEKMAAVTTNVIWAGSAGLAEVLPEILEISEKSASRELPGSAQVMTVCGSLSQVTQQQVRFAREQENVTSVKLETGEIFGENWNTVREEVEASCLKGLADGGDLVLYVPSNEKVRDEVKRRGRELGLSSGEIGERIAGAIGALTADIAAKSNVSGLVLTGGDIAKAASRELGGIGFRLIKQVEAGIPLGTIIGTEKEYTAVTKAGAFGKENSIYKAMLELKGVHVS
ncbi:four-carbon acid sugar kinase family protein [Evansella sp. LMS18]|jgi:uncharacterized protein YgbK (DUF1537 family)|uniref:four-carbon acid sugar kinase family protein n=1 Tax=Evansella sp. LMS18 TaxID=2924033 RepID=UPI0020D04D62|nr:four-carbon acid sugar kinase family protein [Evansella sp. LMS18]UTR12765.1 four-carbon acid sugar kinase family protein [Evansella sp. LMS18]